MSCGPSRRLRDHPHEPVQPGTQAITIASHVTNITSHLATPKPLKWRHSRVGPYKILFIFFPSTGRSDQRPKTLQMPRILRQLRVENLLESRHRFPQRRPTTQRKIFLRDTRGWVQRRPRRSAPRAQTPTTKTAPAIPQAASQAQAQRIRTRSILLPKITKFLRKRRECRFPWDRWPPMQQDELRIEWLREHVLRPRLRPHSRKPYRIQMPISLVL